MSLNKGVSFIVAVGVFVAGLILGGLLTGDNISSHDAVAQPRRTAGVGGVMAFTGQIDRDRYGIIMVDVDVGTLWVYQFTRPDQHLKLVTARTWIYDRYLEEYNCAGLAPGEVAGLVGKQHRAIKGPKNLESAPAEGIK